MQVLSRKNQDITLVEEINYELQNRVSENKKYAKDKKIDFPKFYYEEHNLLQTLTEIENEKQQKIDDCLNLASACFEKDFSNPENID